MTSLETYGWNDTRSQQWTDLNNPDLIPGRIVADYGSLYTVATPELIPARLSGSSSHKLASTDMPKIGDWVAVEQKEDDTSVIHHVLPRSTEIVRGHVGRLLDKQVVAANIDLAFVIQPLDHDFSPERLQRYIFQLSTQSIKVVILLNKADQAKSIPERQAQLERLDTEIVTMSALHDEDLSILDQYLVPQSTIVILGSSGAGKSTLTNRLLGEQRQHTQPIRERDSKGRHTTVHRELFVLPSGAMIVDTPGIRELQLWGDVSDLEATFPEIFETARQCHYNDCSHDTEDRCAIKKALADGVIDPKRYSVYRSFARELELLDARRGYIDTRRTEQAKASAKRRRRHLERASERTTIDETDIIDD